MEIKKWGILIAHALVVWAICGAIMFIGMELTTMTATLIIHAIGAPIASALLVYLYHRKYAGFSPLKVATIFVGTALFMDFFLVAMVIEKSFEMFASFVGLWLPMILIFTAAWLTGSYVIGRKPSQQ